MDNESQTPNDYNRATFSIREMVGEAWRAVHGFKAPFWGGFFFVLCVLIGLYVVTFPLHVLGQWLGFSRVVDILSLIIIEIFYLPASTGLFLLSVYRLRQAPVKATQIFIPYRWRIMWRILVAGIILYAVIIVLSILGALWLFPFIFIIVYLMILWISVIWILSVLLIIDKKMGLWRALLLASCATSHRILKVFGVIFVILAFILLSGITLFIGSIWFLPLINNLYGALYRHFFENQLSVKG